MTATTYTKSQQYQADRDMYPGWAGVMDRLNMLPGQMTLWKGEILQMTLKNLYIAEHTLSGE